MFQFHVEFWIQELFFLSERFLKVFDFDNSEQLITSKKVRQIRSG